MSPELTQAIERTKQLFKARDHSQDWGRNILEGSKGLTTQEDWTLYYSYLTNPQQFDPNAVLETVDPNYVIEAPPDELEVVTHKNGTDIDIVYKRKAGSETVVEEKEEKVNFV